MAYGDYDGPDKPNKGQEGGACNRSRCQAEPANWYNHGSYAWYCDDCREQIEFDHVNLRHWQLEFQPSCGHPQFETREMMDARTDVVPTHKGERLAEMVRTYIHRAEPVVTEFRLERPERQAPRPRDQYHMRRGWKPR